MLCFFWFFFFEFYEIECVSFVYGIVVFFEVRVGFVFCFFIFRFFLGRFYKRIVVFLVYVICG